MPIEKRREILNDMAIQTAGFSGSDPMYLVDDESMERRAAREIWYEESGYLEKFRSLCKKANDEDLSISKLRREAIEKGELPNPFPVSGKTAWDKYFEYSKDRK